MGFHYLNNLLSRGLLPVSFSISLTTYINYCPQKHRTCMYLEKTLMKNIMFILQALLDFQSTVSITNSTSAPRQVETLKQYCMSTFNLEIN